MVKAIFNINEEVEVTLTKEGAKVFTDRMEKYKLDWDVFKVYFTDIDNRVMKIPMHELINIFGETIAKGSIAPFVGGNMKVISRC